MAIRSLATVDYGHAGDQELEHGVEAHPQALRAWPVVQKTGSEKRRGGTGSQMKRRTFPEPLLHGSWSRCLEASSRWHPGGEPGI